MHFPAKSVARDIVVACKSGQERFATLSDAVLRYRREIGRALDWAEAGLSHDAGSIPLEHPKFPVGIHFPLPGNLVFFDEVGLIIPAAVVYGTYRRLGLDWRSWTVVRLPVEDHVFRRGPVPRTGRRRGRWRAYFRTPATFQELRRNEADRNDGLLDVRSRRRSVELDIDFDDKARGRRSRGWKECRRNQWRG